MVAKEALQVEENLGHFQDLYEEEETLSLCDLPIRSDPSQWDAESSSLDDENNDGFFEFFSEDFTASTYPSSGKDIIFCGKLIPYKELSPPRLSDDCHHHHQKAHQNLETKKNNKRKVSIKKGFRLWKSYSFRKLVRPFSSSNSIKGSKDGGNMRNSKPQHVAKANSENYNKRKSSTGDHHHQPVSVGKVSVLSTPTKSSRWYLYMFGMARLPTEMELRDIKNRQSRRTPSMLFSPEEYFSTEMVEEKVVGKRGTSGKGLWSFLRGLGCRSISSPQPSSGVVKASCGSNIPKLCES